jgi:type IV secretory pathway VirB10-like protein
MCCAVLTCASTAELLRGCDRYLFNLDHFTDLLEAQQQQQQQQQQGGQQQQQQSRVEQRQQRLPPPPPRQEQAGGQQSLPQPTPPPPPPPGQQQGRQQQQQQQQQPQPGVASGTLSRSLSAAAASSGSLPGRKRQKQQQQQSGDVGGRGEADGLDEGEGPVGCSNPILPPLHPEMRDTHLVVDASHEVSTHNFERSCACRPVYVLLAFSTRNSRQNAQKKG